MMCDLEQQAEQLITSGQIDQAIELYKTLQSPSSDILNIIGNLYASQKADDHLAIYYFQQALDLQEKNNEDPSHTLTQLGLAHQNLHNYELALAYHFRALTIRQQNEQNNQVLIVHSLFGIANAYWRQENLSDALKYAEQALAINLSIESDNEMNIAANLAILGNIYHNLGDNVRALELSKQALNIFERYTPSDSLTLSTLLTNIGSIEVSMGLLDDGLLIFIRVLNIYDKNVSENHPKRQAIINSIRQLSQAQQSGGLKVINKCRELITKLSLL